MDHPAVVARLMGRDRLLLLEYGDRDASARLEEPVRGRQADDPATDHRNVVALTHGAAPGY